VAVTVGEEAMKIYEPDVQESFEWAILERDEDHEILYDLGSTAVAERWDPLPARLMTQDPRSGRRRARADLPWLGPHVIVLRDRAIEALRPLLVPFGELLPLLCPEARLALWHVTHVIDALDEERSQVLRYPTSDRIMKIAMHRFKRGVLDPPQAFKIPQMPRGAIFLTDDLVRSIDAFGFKGTTFRLDGQVPTE
jgi:hypothetical protein